MSAFRTLLLAAMLCAMAPALVCAQDNHPLTVEQCIEIALEHNQQRKISRLNIEVAEAQLKQALSAYWPQLSFTSGFNRLDEDLNFIFPQETSQYTITGMAPVPVTAEVTVPTKDIKIMDRDNLMSRLKMVYPLFTGGLRGALQRQGEAGVAAAQQAHRRSEIQLIYDVKRFYYGAILAQHLARIGDNTLARLAATVDLTETLYKAGSQSVNKMDYLRSKVFLDSVRGVVTSIHTNVELSYMALANTMGCPWDQTLVLSENQVPYTPVHIDPGEMVADGYQFNPDWKQLSAAVKAYEAKVDEEKSNRWPKIGVNGTLWRWDNSMDNEGISTDQNVQGWSVGVGLQVPIFSGFLTTNKIKAAQASLEAMQARRLLLKEGLAVQIKHAVIELANAQKVHASATAAGDTARNLRDLTERAYRQEMSTADKVIESQVMEALTSAKAEQARYNHAVAMFQLSFLVGRELGQLLE